MKFLLRHSLGLVIISALTVFTGLNIAPSFAATTPTHCLVTNLSLGVGDRISPATGEHGDVYKLTNHGKLTCQLRGYPGITLYDHAHQILPFRYLRGGGQWVTHKAPKMVVLNPGNYGFFLIAKYRCDIGISMSATTIRVYPPNDMRQITGPASSIAGVSKLEYCKGGTKDPGNLVYISPVAATLRAVFPTMVR
jgi:hypothetical protein